MWFQNWRLAYIFGAHNLKPIAIDSEKLFQSGIYIKHVLSIDNHNDARSINNLSSDKIETAEIPVNFLISNAWRNNNARLMLRCL